MEENIIIVSDCRNLSLKIKVIGYRNQGESIVFEVVDTSTGQIQYLGCVDSYEVDNTGQAEIPVHLLKLKILNVKV